MAKSDAPANFTEAMQTVITALAKAMSAPGADIRFCQQAMMACAGRIQQSHGENAQHQQPGAVGVGGAGMPPGAGPQGPPGGKPPSPPGMSMPGNPAGGGAVNPQMASQAAPGLMSGSPTPTPDELRRVISQSAGS